MCVERPEQGPKLGVPVAMEQRRVAPASALKPKLGVLSLVGPEGPESTETLGATMSVSSCSDQP